MFSYVSYKLTMYLHYKTHKSFIQGATEITLRLCRVKYILIT